MMPVPSIDTVRDPRFEVVSFDVFDTLLLRRCSPREVARSAAELLAQSLTGSETSLLNADAIVAHRQAWTAVREADYPRVEVEWCIDQWLVDLAAAAGIEPEAMRERGRDAELRAELAATTPSPIAAILLAEARRARKRVVALSDTTLDADLLGRLLASHIIAVDRVFASCDLGASKRRGTAYAALAREMGVSPAAIVHVGDNLKVDLIRARGAGVVGLWLPRTDPRREAEELVGTVFAASGRPSSDPVEASVEAHVAPLLVAMGIARSRFGRRLGATSTLYLARDAWLMQLVDERCGVASADAHYVRISRKAVALAHPDDLLVSIGLSGKVGKRSLRAFLGGFDLPPDLERELVSLSGVAPDAPIDGKARLRWTRACHSLRPAIVAAQEQRREMIAELLRPSLGGHAGTVVVDLGWAGTIQDAIGASCPDVAVHGFYAGLTAGGRSPGPRGQKQGLLWDAYRGIDPIPLGKSAGVIRLWELLLREPAPTVIGLRRDDRGRPIVEFGESSVIDGRAAALAERVRRGVERALDRVAHRAPHLVDAGTSAVDEALAASARGHFARLSMSPPAAFARAILEIPMDEGATRGVKTTLGLGGMREGVTWWPGLGAAVMGRRGISG